MQTTRLLPLAAAVMLAAACQGANPAAPSTALPPARFDGVSTMGSGGFTANETDVPQESCPVGPVTTSTGPTQPSSGSQSICRGVNMLGSGN
ncbi:MAG TPA: hypothetical protein VFQ39_16190 [Longimicrobium sp.]|nr:hypothetical protein [Longimicrobium sp.]